MICFTPVVINGMFPGSTPRLDLAIGVRHHRHLRLDDRAGGAAVGDRRALHPLHAAARANHDGFLELARHDWSFGIVGARAGGSAWARCYYAQQRRGRTRHDFLTWTRIGVPISPNDSRSWLARNRS